MDSLVCATDAGREGELIFRLVYLQAGCKKPFERLWISSMEDAAIRDGFTNLKPGTDYDNLFASALSRAQADWIVGINASRLFSCLYGASLNVGRVQSPTLAMMVQRAGEIQNFKKEKILPRPYQSGRRRRHRGAYQNQKGSRTPCKRPAIKSRPFCRLWQRSKRRKTRPSSLILPAYSGKQPAVWLHGPADP